VDPLTGLLGDSRAFEAVKARSRRLLAGMRESRRVPLVLIEGETGSGKSLLARALHMASSRSSKPFVAVNCAAIPETLAESELFGYEAGAHSEARRAKPGLFHAAAGGTIFLDEVGLLSAAVQTKLLKVIEDRRVRRIGGTQDEAVDVWIISATNTDLEADVRSQKFRSDLYQRLTVVRLNLPPLRDREDDVTKLAEEFAARTCADYGLPPKRLAPDAQARLTQHSWPGNVRELSNVIERAVLLSDGDVIAAEHLELDRGGAPEAEAAPAAAPSATALRDTHLAVLEQTGWNISRASTLLGISRKTLRARIARFGLRPGGGALAADHPEAAEVAAVPERLEPEPLGSFGATSPANIAAAPSEPVVPATRAFRWQRQRVTILRVNLVLPPGSDPLNYEPAVLDDAIDKAQVFGGHLEGLSTTWALVSFGAAPLEDSSGRAAHAALAIQRAAAGRDDRRPAQIATLEMSNLLVARSGRTAEIDREGLQALEGQLTEMAARCEAGWIGVGPTAGPFLERRFELERIGAPPALSALQYRLVGPKSPEQAELTAPMQFVGREAEVGLLRNRLESMAHGHGQIVAIVGDAGVGKSRLLSEFSRLLDRTQFRVRHAQALLPTGPSLLPAIDLMRRHLQIDDGDGEAEVRVKIDRAISPGRHPDPWAAAALCELLGVPTSDPGWSALDPRERREQTLHALQRVLIAESHRGPLVVIFEDLHWVDSETQALIDRLVDAVPSARILLLLTYRPEHRHQWQTPLHYSELWLEPLTRKDAGQVLDNLMGGDPSLANIKDRLIDWTEGNPFFLEESVRYLATAGELVGNPGRYQLMNPDAALQIPPTVEEVLAERIEHLAPEMRAILECAAVVGRNTSMSLLSAGLQQPEARLESGLKALHEVDLLHDTGEAEDRVFRFKHAITHDVTYRRLSPERRRALHAEIFRHLESINPAAAGEALDRLAFHAFRGEVWERARVYCRRAGERAHRRSSNAEAAGYFRQARRCLERLPETPERLGEAIDVLFGLRWALWPLGQLAEIGRALREAEGLAAKLGDLRRQGMVAAYLADYLWATGQNAAAAETGMRALAIAERVRDDILVGQARFGLGLARAALGQYREAAEIVAPAAALMKGDPSDYQWRVIAMAKAYLARYLAEVGDFSGALSSGESGLRTAEASGDSFALLASLLGLGTLHLRRADLPAAIDVLSRGLEVARAKDHVNFVPSLSSSLGLACVLSGRVDEGLVLLADALASAESSGIPASRPLWMAYAAEGHGAAGRARSARALAERALQAAKAGGEAGHEAWALRALANAIDESGDEEPDAAIKVIERAAEQAESLGMRPLVTRCRIDLARMLDRRGRHVDASAARAEASRLARALGMANDPGAPGR
jgi:transcriptional regulator with AAA-type ATPase domain/tetratricopeptide (TPR) repeat protein/energy-coupling factor transporter ATP-binding protein EcfA2